MKRLVAALVGVLGAISITCSSVACSSPSAGEEPAPKQDTLRSRLEGQGIAILPLDQTNEACGVNPTTMDRHTFASCTRLEADKLPAQLSITEDASAFDPDPERGMILVVKVLPVEEELASTPDNWHALIGLGRLKDLASSGSLVNGGGASTQRTHGGIHPNVAFLLAPAAPMLVSATEALIVAGIAFFGAKAVVATAEQISKARQESLVRSTEEALVEQTELLCKTYTCDGSSKECAGKASGTPCKYADANGTTYGSESGFCGGTRSFSAIRDRAGKPTGQCTAPCVCRDARARR